VRANLGQFAEHFLRGGYAGIEWREIARDLGDIRSRDELYPLVREAYPDQQSPVVIGNSVGQVLRRRLTTLTASSWTNCWSGREPGHRSRSQVIGRYKTPLAKSSRFAALAMSSRSSI
jgi:hypothetical protein